MVNIKSGFAQIAQRAIAAGSKDALKAIVALASGSRINSAADDAAGLSISSRTNADIRTSTQAIRNANDGISLANIGDAALGTANESITRIRELSLQAANGTLSQEQRDTLQLEAQQLAEQIDQTFQTTEFNGINPLQNGSISIQIGPDGSDTLQSPNLSAPGAPAVDFSSAAAAAATADAFGSYQNDITSIRGDFGSFVNRIEVGISNLRSSVENLAAAEARIVDADIAQEAARLVSARIREQGAASLLSNSFTNQKNILDTLLK